MRASISVLVSLLAVAGCADTRGRGSPTDSGVSMMDAAPTDDRDAGRAGTDAGPPVRSCSVECFSVADCDTPGAAAFDADNWACNAGRCEYLGCASDLECEETWPTLPETYRCDTAVDPPSCYPVCTSAADCAPSEMGAFTAENYECRAGHCIYLGCTSDQECEETWPTLPETYRCDGTTEPPTCYPVCTSAADCAASETGAFNADNYECRSGHCIYLGCTSDAECEETWPTLPETYRCR